MASHAARRRRALAGLGAFGALLGFGAAWAADGSDVVADTTPPVAQATPVVHADPGELVISGVDGTKPTRSLLRRAEVGQIAGVILMGRSTRSAAQVTALTAELQAAAARGGQPPLLVMTDQEGGTVRRLAFARPSLSARAMAGLGMDGVRTQGHGTGDDLRKVGINVDLAPVADVPSGARSFLGTRAFGTTPSAVARNACAFAEGLAKGGVVATLKHFPGLGAAGTVNTDDASVTIRTSRTQLERAWTTYRQCGASLGTAPPAGVPAAPLVMVSSAAYPALTGSTPAVLSSATYRAARSLGAEGPYVTDALEAGALRGRVKVASRAVTAGAHLLLYTDETASKAGRRDVLANATQVVVDARAARVRALREALAG